MRGLIWSFPHNLTLRGRLAEVQSVAGLFHGAHVRLLYGQGDAFVS
ncbi:hypothetical protein [Streptomyces lucensis]